MELNQLKELHDPAGLESDHLRALWYDLNGDWDTAHAIIQEIPDRHASWIHAYLHRKEPDIWNAKYWYRRAGMTFPGDLGFDLEAAEILIALQG